MIQNILIFCMIVSYLFPIYIVSIKYIDNYSISSIICNENCNKDIFSWMAIMGGFTILYELSRNNNISLTLISFLLIGITGVLNTKEEDKLHILSALVVFISIIIFMYYFSELYNDKILKYLFYMQLLLSIINILLIKKNIFFTETLSLFNFAVFYLYLHTK